MAIHDIPNSKENTPYYLICYDANGDEKQDDPAVKSGVLSNMVLHEAETGGYTDIFLISHGWKGDVPAAIYQYDLWTAAMVSCENDIARLKARPQGFKPLVIGLHWPSLPFGVETQKPLAEGDTLFDFSIAGEDWKEEAIRSIADSEEGRKAARIIVDTHDLNDAPQQLNAEVLDAINTILNTELKNKSEEANPAEDQPETDAQSLYSQLLDTDNKELLSFGIGGRRGPITNLLTQLSSWKMKARGRVFGENGAAKLLRSLQSVTTDSTQFHLIGHSFGTVVVSSAVTGKGGKEPLPRPVNSIYLIQGAVSLWSFCKNIPVLSNKPGYYSRISDSNYLSGPLLVTYTEKDTANKTLYPLMAKVAFAETVSFDMSQPSYPRHGALGTFGAQGLGIAIEALDMLPLDESYGFKSGTIFNIQAGEYVKANESRFGGSHNDIAHPEVAHVFLSAIK